MCLNWLNTVPLNGSHTYKEVTRSPISASQSWGSCSSGIPTGTYPTSRATKLLNQRATASLSLSERPKGSTSHSYQPGSIPYLTAVNLSVNNQYRTVLGGVGSGGGGGWVFLSQVFSPLLPKIWPLQSPPSGGDAVLSLHLEGVSMWVCTCISREMDWVYQKTWSVQPYFKIKAFYSNPESRALEHTVQLLREIPGRGVTSVSWAKCSFSSQTAKPL